MSPNESYQLPQNSLASLKTAIHLLLPLNSDALTNAEIGRSFGIYYGHSGKHIGHIPRVILDIMKGEGVVVQDARTKRWTIRTTAV